MAAGALSIHSADTHNEAAFRHLHAALRAQPRPVAFIGAGVSMDAGYPSWKELLNRLHASAFPSDGADATHAGIARSEDGLWRAQVYKQELAGNYLRVLVRALKARNPKRKSHGIADHLAALQFSHYLTTNYETVLGDALERTGCQPVPVDAQETSAMRQFLANINAAKQHLIYLHGRIEKPESIILTESDYLQRYRGTVRAERDLFAVLATRRVVFVGFSLSDPDLIEIMRVMRGEEVGEPRHFALLPLENPDEENTVRARYRLKFGVEAIFYLPHDNHRNLVEILKLLRTDAPNFEALPRLGAAVERVAGAEREATVLDPDDPQKGRWGGQAQRNGRSVTAKVTPVGKSNDWFRIIITVESTNGQPLRGPVYIHVHDTFPKPYYEARFANRRQLQASLRLHAYGAFTIGVACDDGATLLELDLADLPDAPKAFREN